MNNISHGALEAIQKSVTNIGKFLDPGGKAFTESDKLIVNTGITQVIRWQVPKGNSLMIPELFFQLVIVLLQFMILPFCRVQFTM